MNKAKHAIEELKRRAAEESQREAAYAERVRADREVAEAEDRDAPPLKLVRPSEENSVNQKLDETCAQLNDDARDFVFVLYWLMSAAGYSERSRSWIVALVAYIDRRDLHKEGAEVTDAELADFMGCSERTVQRARADYLREKHRRLEIVAITEGDYDHSREQNRPTRYRFICDYLVGDAVTDARALKLWQGDYRAALKKAAFDAYDRERRLRENLPHATHRRKKREKSPETERERIRKTMLTLAASLREIEGRLPADYSAEWEELKGKLDEAYRGDKNLNSPQTSDSKADDPMGRQLVAPSVMDVIVSKDVPNDVETLMRVPSVARVMRQAMPKEENGHLPPGSLEVEL